MVDISNYNPITDWQQVKSNVSVAIYVHAFEYGPNTQSFPSNWTNIQAIGLQRGAYCFARPDAYTPITNADAFCSYVQSQGFGGTDFLVLDAEVGGIDGSWAYIFLDRCRQKGMPVALYCSTSYLYDHLSCDQRLSDFALIVADYGPNDGQDHGISQPLPWPEWAHQYTSVGTVNGITGNVDCNTITHPNLNPSQDTMTPEQAQQLADIWNSVVNPAGLTYAIANQLYASPDGIGQHISNTVNTILTNQSGLTSDQINNMATAIAQAVVNAILPELHGSWKAGS